ncbi:unnamed protein product [Adineta steineri]|uniref:Uncharacterized protein n=1 Tax=Adineta steineri TaxID=433720 RepID=A0A813M6U4_9BILA|nr:unnamed protein product [Adineta steineri]
MSRSFIESEIEEELSKEKQAIFERLSNIFDPDTAISFVCPQTNEARDNTSLEELNLLNSNDQEEFLQRLRSAVHFTTTTQSLSHVDLEAAYQSFVRDQVAQQASRQELEQFVRNSSDIDSAKRYLDMANEVLINPHQSQLLFRSSKLNEQKANLLKSSGYSNSLQQLNNDPSIQKYFSETINNTSRYPIQDEEEEFFTDKQNLSRSQSMHVQHKEKKYHVKFLKDLDAHNPIYRPISTRRLPSTKRLAERNIESLFAKDSSIVQGQSTESNLHHETFPPLTLAALKEYRPTFTPKSTSLQRMSSAISIQQRRKPMRKADFIWNQSIVSSAKHK